MSETGKNSFSSREHSKYEYYLDSRFTWNSLFGADPDNYSYSGYGIGFNVYGTLRVS